ncbi:MAG: helix-turn-helix domain-containing protein [Planctomycetes bacterium]|nr:helix-turn-helix domain-containing protein [Planctomycetota bacterium]
MQKRYRVTLTAEEIQILDNLLSKGKHSSQKRNRAQTLLLTNQGWTDIQVSETVGITRRAVETIRQRFVEDGFELVLAGKPRKPRKPVLDARAEAHLAALVCSTKPAGHKRWTIRLLQNRLVADLEELESVSHETIRQTLKKLNLSLGSG